MTLSVRGMNRPTFTQNTSSLVSVAPAAKTVIMVLVAGIAIATILIIVDYFYPFLPFSTVGGPSAAARAGVTFWKSVESDTENLVVPTNSSPTTSASSWSCSVQLIVADSRAPSAGMFRHILHRGSNPAGIPTTTAGSTGQAGIQPTDIDPSADPSYKEQGLPQVMNPGIFLDKYKNDIHIFIHTRGSEDNEKVLWLESMTLQDVPLNQPLTLGIACNGRQVDVYLNCRLYNTLLLKGTPYLPKADNQWFGRYGAYPFAGLVKNLELWNTDLNSGDYVQVCRSASFNLNALPSTCPTASSKSLSPVPPT